MGTSHIIILKSNLWYNRSHKTSNELQKYLYMREGCLFVLLEIVHVHVRYVNLMWGCKFAIMSCSFELFKGVIAMWTWVICLKGELDIFHKRVYLMGQCPDCDVEKLQLCPQWNCKWKVCAMVMHRVCGNWEGSNGQDKKVSRVEYKHTPPSEPITYLKP
jgi:hypothetical protein